MPTSMLEKGQEEFLRRYAEGVHIEYVYWQNQAGDQRRDVRVKGNRVSYRTMDCEPKRTTVKAFVKWMVPDTTIHFVHVPRPVFLGDTYMGTFP